MPCLLGPADRRPCWRLDQYAELLAIRERVSGPEHPDTLTTRANLATVTALAGDPAAAQDQFAGLLPTLERVFGPDDQNTVITRQELNRWITRANGDL